MKTDWLFLDEKKVCCALWVVGVHFCHFWFPPRHLVRCGNGCLSSQNISRDGTKANEKYIVWQLVNVFWFILILYMHWLKFLFLRIWLIIIHSLHVTFIANCNCLFKGRFKLMNRLPIIVVKKLRSQTFWCEWPS